MNRASSGIGGDFVHRAGSDPVASFRLVERPPTANRPPASSKTCPDLRNVSCNVPLTRRKSNRIGWNRIHHRSLNRLKIESFRSINLSLFSLPFFSLLIGIQLHEMYSFFSPFLNNDNNGGKRGAEISLPIETSPSNSTILIFVVPPRRSGWPGSRPSSSSTQFGRKIRETHNDPLLVARKIPRNSRAIYNDPYFSLSKSRQLCDPSVTRDCQKLLSPFPKSLVSNLVSLRHSNNKRCEFEEAPFIPSFNNLIFW